MAPPEETTLNQATNNVGLSFIAFICVGAFVVAKAISLAMWLVYLIGIALAALGVVLILKSSARRFVARHDKAVWGVVSAAILGSCPGYEWADHLRTLEARREAQVARERNDAEARVRAVQEREAELRRNAGNAAIKIGQLVQALDAAVARADWSETSKLLDQLDQIASPYKNLKNLPSEMTTALQSVERSTTHAAEILRARSHSERAKNDIETGKKHLRQGDLQSLLSAEKAFADAARCLESIAPEYGAYVPSPVRDLTNVRRLQAQVESRIKARYERVKAKEARCRAIFKTAGMSFDSSRQLGECMVKANE